MSNTYRSKQHRRRHNTKSLYKRLYSHQRAKARYRGHDWELTIEQWYALIKSDCYLCGSKPSNVFKPVKGEISSAVLGQVFIYNGLDRVNNNKGYTPENAAPCCAKCNSIKSKQTLSGLAQQIKKIQNHGVLEDIKEFIKSLKDRSKDENKAS